VSADDDMVNLYRQRSAMEVVLSAQRYLQQVQGPFHSTFTAQVSIAKDISQVAMHEDLVWQNTQGLGLDNKAVAAANPENLRARGSCRSDEILWHRDRSVLLPDHVMEIKRHFEGG
jgi:hypothetical protein